MVDIFLAEGFEEIEALTPVDLLRRAGVTVRTVGVGGKVITGSHGISVTADITGDKWTSEETEMVVLPGGMPGTKNLDASPVVDKALSEAVEKNIPIAAICAAPSILGKRGLLAGRKAICFPGFEEALTGAKIARKKVVRDGQFITAAGMGVATQFGLALVEALCGKEKAAGLQKSILAD